jgi:Transglycosylase SLT domain
LEWLLKAITGILLMANSQWTGLANQMGEHFGVPPALILSFIDMESGGNPLSVSSTGAVGLMQLTGGVLKSYSERNNLNVTKQDVMNDPELNMRIGTEYIKRIALLYQKYNGLAPRWDNKTYIHLIAMGYNAGPSVQGGVSYVLTQLAKSGIGKERWSLETILKAAQKLPQAQTFYRNATRSATWYKGVADLYFRISKIADDKQAAAINQPTSDDKWSTGKKILVFGGIATAAGIAYALFGKESSSDNTASLGNMGGHVLHIHNHR